ncbi:MAG TPA: iron ABC transporter permease [Armatimonadota bacterium]|jgi:iron complex transport system permease protein
MKRWRGVAVIVALVLLLAEATALSLATGPAPLEAGRAFRILLSPLPGLHDLAADATETDRNIVFEVRLPRFLMALLVGAALAVAGVVMQSLFQNPMAEPSIIGVSAGAALGATVALTLGLSFTFLGLTALPLAAFAGAVGVTGLVYVLSRRGGRTPVGLLLLTGIAVASLCSSIASLILVRGNNAQVSDVVFWMMGSVAYQGWKEVYMILPYALLGTVVACVYARDLNALLLGDEQAAYLGINVERVKLVLLGCGALLAASAVAVAGIVGFVGLVVPHLMRILVGPDHRILVPVSFLAGGLLVTLSALLATRLGAVPLGIITALLGAPFFLYLLHRQGTYRF